ncbi:MAG: histidinol dehydrogenase, partial [Planctomycetota bacterium]|nr:histidinol dehydrogenase [Planctomycetota bacterium]
VRIDMLAGPSELVVVADIGAAPALVAADLLAQAEHDINAVPILIAMDESVVESVERELASQLEALSTRTTARAALNNGFALIANNIEEAIETCDGLAPEHLQLSLRNAPTIASQFTNYGALFVGEQSGEVLGDYGAGPNHVLPTGGTARHTSGLSIFNFLRFPTQLRIDDSRLAQPIIDDAIELARLERLEGHRHAAVRRQREANTQVL